MSWEKISYKEQEGVLRQSAIFFGGALEKRGYAGKICVRTYRYGFNGKEKDQNGEWGNQNHYDYGFRIYNPAIARFLSVDPLTKSYPMLTPYQFASNTPIQAIDLDGLEAKIVVNSQYNIKRIAKLLHSYKSDVSQKVREQAALAIAYYSTEETYPNDANTRMYPDINFPESGLAAEGTVDNSFEGIEIWGIIEDGNGGDSEVYLGTVRKEKSVVEKVSNYVVGGKVRDATDFERILIENFDQEAVTELADHFARSPEKFKVFLKFLKEKNVIEENTVRGGRNTFVPESKTLKRGDTTFTYHGNYKIDDNDTLYDYQDIPLNPKRDED